MVVVNTRMTSVTGSKLTGFAGQMEKAIIEASKKLFSLQQEFFDSSRKNGIDEERIEVAWNTVIVAFSVAPSVSRSSPVVVSSPPSRNPPLVKSPVVVSSPPINNQPLIATSESSSEESDRKQKIVDLTDDSKRRRTDQLECEKSEETKKKQRKLWKKLGNPKETIVFSYHDNEAKGIFRNYYTCLPCGKENQNRGEVKKFRGHSDSAKHQEALAKYKVNQAKYNELKL